MRTSRIQAWYQNPKKHLILPNSVIRHGQVQLRVNVEKKDRCSFHYNCLTLGDVARPERFELPAFWFVVGKAGNPKALQVPHLQAAPASKLLPQLVHK